MIAFKRLVAIMRINQELIAARVELEMMVKILEYVNEQERKYPMLKLIRKIREQIDLFLDGQPAPAYYPIGVF